MDPCRKIWFYTPSQIAAAIAGTLATAAAILAIFCIFC